MLRMLRETFVLPSAVFSKIATTRSPSRSRDKPMRHPLHPQEGRPDQVVSPSTEAYWGKTFCGGLPVMSTIIHPIFKVQRGRQPQFVDGRLDV